VRGNGIEVDKIIFLFNKIVADGTVYQSKWSKEQNLLLGMPAGTASTVVMNAPDPTIFYPENRTKQDRKLKIISTSWSANPRKGFDIYRYLDQHLDWNRYEMTFVGNSPISFGRVKLIPHVESIELASLLRQHDIFLTASRQDPCSNSLIEALHCGLPSVGLNSGGHPEIIREAGELFESEKDVLSAIDKVASNLEFYQKKIAVPTIEEAGNAYYHFAEEVITARKHRKITNKHFSVPDLFKLISRSLWSRYSL
jgi:glycosyltransferase involved in cell wall biosynthesis